MSSEGKFKFSEYYKNNPEFREKHNKYMCEKVSCICGFVTARSNMTKHKKSSNHTKRIDEAEDNLERNIKKNYEALNL